MANPMGDLNLPNLQSFMTFPRESGEHWYLELFPPTAVIAGFEIGSGMFANTVKCDRVRQLFEQTMV